MTKQKKASWDVGLQQDEHRNVMIEKSQMNEPTRSAHKVRGRNRVALRRKIQIYDLPDGHPDGVPSNQLSD